MFSCVMADGRVRMVATVWGGQSPAFELRVARCFAVVSYVLALLVDARHA